jgi:hypothetical protein
LTNAGLSPALKKTCWKIDATTRAMTVYPMTIHAARQSLRG